jgi:hypothetical protein
MDVCAAATCDLPERMEPVAPEPDDSWDEASAPLSSDAAAGESVAAIADATSVEAESDDTLDPFATLVRVLEDVVRASGGNDEVVAGMRTLLGEGRLQATRLSEPSVDALVAGMQLERTPRGIKRTASFTDSVLGWQGILRGESEDFGACGATALDEWAANVVARVLGNPMPANGLRRELRRRGVAAFGLVADAA